MYTKISKAYVHIYSLYRGHFILKFVPFTRSKKSPRAVYYTVYTRDIY